MQTVLGNGFDSLNLMIGITPETLSSATEPWNSSNERAMALLSLAKQGSQPLVHRSPLGGEYFVANQLAGAMLGADLTIESNCHLPLFHRARGEPLDRQHELNRTVVLFGTATQKFVLFLDRWQGYRSHDAGDFAILAQGNFDFCGQISRLVRE